MASIRQRLASDLIGCAETLRALHKDTGYPVRSTDDPIGFLSSDRLIKAWVAELDGRIVGHVAVVNADSSAGEVVLWRQQGHEDDIASLERLFVHPDAQGLGIAAQLLTTAVNYAATESRRLVLYSLEKFSIARKLYKKLGWECFGTFEYRWAEDNRMNAHCFVSPAFEQGE